MGNGKRKRRHGGEWLAGADHASGLPSGQGIYPVRGTSSLRPHISRSPRASDASASAALL